jgi:hypothetical protein
MKGIEGKTSRFEGKSIPEGVDSVASRVSGESPIVFRAVAKGTPP